MHDLDNLLSNDQLLTVSAPSENVYDFGDLTSKVNAENYYNKIMLILSITEQFLGGDTLYITLQTDDSEDFSSPVNLCLTSEVGVEWLLPSRDFMIDYIPPGMKQYFRLYYTVSGIMISGRITAAMTLDKPAALSGHEFGFLKILLDTEGEPILTTGDEYIII